MIHHQCLYVSHPFPMFLIHNKNCKSVYCSLQFGCGSVHDSVSGIAHYLEHLLLRGNDEYEKKELVKMNKDNYININANTTREYTRYQSISSEKYYSRDVQLLLSLLTKPSFNKIIIKNELKNIINERNMIQLDRTQLFLQSKHEQLFGRNSLLGHDILGNVGIIPTIQNLNTFYQQHYCLKNLTGVISAPSSSLLNKTCDMSEQHFQKQNLFIPSHSKLISPNVSMNEGTRVMKYNKPLVRRSQTCLTAKGSYRNRLLGDVVTFSINKKQPCYHIPYSSINSIVSNQRIYKSMITINTTMINDYLSLAQYYFKNDNQYSVDFYLKFVLITYNLP